MRGCLRWGAKVDGNERGIIKDLKRAGVSVERLGRVGGGCPDLLLGWKGKNWLAEVKSEDGELTEGQEGWIEEWRGGEVIVGRTSEEILRAIGALR